MDHCEVAQFFDAINDSPSLLETLLHCCVLDEQAVKGLEGYLLILLIIAVLFLIASVIVILSSDSWKYLVIFLGSFDGHVNYSCRCQTVSQPCHCR
jgi:hypothetical protein